MSTLRYKSQVIFYSSFTVFDECERIGLLNQHTVFLIQFFSMEFQDAKILFLRAHLNRVACDSCCFPGAMT